MNVAKNLMARYVDSREGELERGGGEVVPTFLISGTYLPESGSGSGSEVGGTNGNEQHEKKEDEDTKMDVDVDVDVKDPSSRKRKHDDHSPSPSSNPQITRRGFTLICGSSSLIKEQKKFIPSSISVHIYSLSSARVKDPGHFLQASGRVRAYKRVIGDDAPEYGTIKGAFGLVTTDKVRESVPDV